MVESMNVGLRDDVNLMYLKLLPNRSGKDALKCAGRSDYKVLAHRLDDIAENEFFAHNWVYSRRLSAAGVMYSAPTAIDSTSAHPSF